MKPVIRNRLGAIEVYTQFPLCMVCYHLSNRHPAITANDISCKYKHTFETVAAEVELPQHSRVGSIAPGNVCNGCAPIADPAEGITISLPKRTVDNRILSTMCTYPKQIIGNCTKICTSIRNRHLYCVHNVKVPLKTPIRQVILADTSG